MTEEQAKALKPGDLIRLHKRLGDVVREVVSVDRKGVEWTYPYLKGEDRETWHSCNSNDRWMFFWEKEPESSTQQ